MKIKIKDNKHMIITDLGQTQNENIVTQMDIQVPEQYKDFTKTICFIFPDGTSGYETISNDEIYTIPNSVSKYSSVEFYVQLNKDDKVFKTETKEIKFFDNQNVVDEITPEELDNFNSVLKILNEEITKVDNIDLDVTKEDNVSTITITKKDGTKKSVEVVDGVIGKDGKPGEKGEPRRTWTTRYSW